MRKIVSGLFMALDGVIEAPDQWHFPYFNDEMGEAVSANIDRCDALLFGRQTFEEFAGYWPSADPEDPFTRYINDSPKYVVSNTLQDVEWQPSTVISGDVLAEIRKLKKQPGKDIGMTGSGTLVRSLLQEGLIDQLDLLVHPVAIGAGKKKLFDDLASQVPLQLVRSTTFTTGVVHLTYGPASG